MKGLDTALFAVCLFAVPGLAWLVGRAMGRRDMKIFGVVVAGALAALLPHLARLAVVASVDPGPFADAFLKHARLSLDSPEIGLFFVTFGVFMTMLGWTATPVLAARR